FDYETLEQVREACLRGKDLAALLSNRIDLAASPAAPAPQGLQRIAEVPIHFADALVRRAPSLQKTRDARPPRAWMNSRLMAKLGVADGQPVRVRQGEGSARLAAALDERLPDDCARIAAAHASTAALGPMFGAVAIERISAEKAA
ncbi:MAG TPA: molybdopterin dinucleotide binding domain-containing protein, partial [Burkholderiales bacterium]